jgi:hypothetical protein
MIKRLNLCVFFGLFWVLACSIIWFLSPFIVIALFLWRV